MIKNLATTALMAIAVSGDTLTATLNNTTVNYNWISQASQIDETQQDYYQKTTNNTELNNYLDIHTNNYSANKYDRYEYVPYMNVSNFYIMQIRPFYTLEDTTITVRENFALKINANTAIPTMINYSMFYTFDPIAQQYIDRTDFQSSKYYFATLNNDVSSKTIIYDNEEEQASLGPNTTFTITANDIPVSHETIWIVINLEVGNDSIEIENTWIRNETSQIYVDFAEVTGTIVYGATSVEVVDIPGLMFYILSMPFAFISQAFNLTLFAGTAYQINISQLFLGLIGIAILLWVLKIILGKTDLSGLVQDAHATKLENTKYKHAKQLEKQKHDNKVAREQQRHENATKEKRK